MFIHFLNHENIEVVKNKFGTILTTRMETVPLWGIWQLSCFIKYLIFPCFYSSGLRHPLLVKLILNMPIYFCCFMRKHSASVFDDLVGSFHSLAFTIWMMIVLVSDIFITTYWEYKKSAKNGYFS